jgi:peroxidase
MTDTHADDALFASLKDLETRSIDGRDNNWTHPDWGSTGEPLIRITNSYPDGKGNDLEALRDHPAPEAVTETVMNADNGGIEGGEPVNVFNSFNVNEYAQFFGQFVAHDIVFSSGGEEEVDGQLSGITRNAGVTVDGVRQQINEETAYLDLGHVYDDDPKKARLLRDPDSGRMLTNDEGLLPGAADIEAAHGVDVEDIESIDDTPLVAGDFRAAQTEQLVSHHTVWLDNHNYHADRLAEQYPKWSNGEIFAAARALNEAEFQWVVFNEYLPAIIGEQNIAPYHGYDAHANAGIRNDFTTGVFRFGHDQANDFFDLLEEDGSVASEGPGEDGTGADVTLSQSFIPIQGEGVGVSKADTLEEQADWIRGQLGIATQKIDGFVVSGNRGGVLGIPGRNLEAFDIVRGREHGVNDYNQFRKEHGLERYETWDDFFTANDVSEVRQGHLRDLYGAKPGDIDNMDTIIGVLLEAKADGSQLGPTATTVIRAQFADLRDGDRFYFENRFTAEQVEEIKNTSLAEIVARTTAVEHVYRDALIAAPRIGGGDEDDRLQGTGDGDLVIGFAGDDRLAGLAGADDLYGGAGSDRLDGGAGEDWLFGSSGPDVLRGGGEADVLYGEGDDDTLVGGAGTDSLHGGEGSDVLRGGDGADSLAGGAGMDVMIGGSDGDRFTYEGGTDLVMDFELGVDTLLLAENLAGGGRRLRSGEDFRALVHETAVERAEGHGLVLDFGEGDRLGLPGVEDAFA